MPDEDQTSFTKQEMELVKRIAARDGVSDGEAATRLAREALARRVRKRTGKGQARVLNFKETGTPRR